MTGPVFIAHHFLSFHHFTCIDLNRLCAKSKSGIDEWKAGSERVGYPQLIINDLPVL